MIQAQNLRKRYRAHEVLKGVSLDVPAGSAFALIGANGAGKTTTIKLLLNLIASNGGQTTVLGVDSRRLSPPDFAKIGYVAQDQKLPNRLSAADYLDYLRPFYPSWDTALAKSLCDQFELPSAVKIRAFSHGMRIKLALICALAFRPKLLVLDEPFAGIDAAARDDLVGGILRQAGETTIFISSHDLDETERMITHLGFLQDGCVLFQNSIEALQDRFREVRAVFEQDITIAEGLPATWLEARAAGRVLNFVDEDYSEERTAARITTIFGPARDIQAQPMSLRSVFTTLIRARRRTV